MQTNHPLACPTSTSNWDSQILKWEGLALVMRKTFPTVRVGQIPRMNQGYVYKLPSLKSSKIRSVLIHPRPFDWPAWRSHYIVQGAQGQHSEVHLPSLLFVSDNRKEKKVNVQRPSLDQTNLHPNCKSSRDSTQTNLKTRLVLHSYVDSYIKCVT